MKRAVGIVLASLAMLLSLSGCMGNAQNVAFTVGDETFSVAQLEHAVATFNEAGLAAQPDNVIQVIAWSRFISSLQGQSKSIDAVTSTDLVELDITQDPTLAKIAAIEGGRQLAADFCQYYLVAGAIYQPKDKATAALSAPLHQDITEAAANLPVTVNPRFGKWEPKQLAVTSSSLSSPAPVAPVGE